jgi:hypothetical protein
LLSFGKQSIANPAARQQGSLLARFAGAFSELFGFRASLRMGHANSTPGETASCSDQACAFGKACGNIHANV